MCGQKKATKTTTQGRKSTVMFNSIRYWFRSKLSELSAWIRRPRTVESAIRQVTSGMEKLGIRIVDTSVYPKSQQGDVVGAVVIVTGYTPEKALIFTVRFNYKTFDDYKFTIQGQVEQGEWSKCRDDENYFPNSTRHPIESECCDAVDHTFDINTYAHRRNMSSKKKVAYGMTFFDKFLDKYGALMRKNFDSGIHLWFVPEYSDELEALEMKNGRYNKTNYIGFNSRVMAKFPAGFFCKAQRA